jgi:hypothetical protein
MCELESCLCDEGVSDVKFTCEGRGWDMVDSWSGGGRDVGGRNRGLFRLWLEWGKGWSLGKGDGLSPESLFIWGKGRGLTMFSVGGRLAPVTTASLINRGSGRGFDLAGFWKRCGLNGWSMAGRGRRKDFLKTRSGGFVFMFGSSAVHADAGVCAG